MNNAEKYMLGFRAAGPNQFTYSAWVLRGEGNKILCAWDNPMQFSSQESAAKYLTERPRLGSLTPARLRFDVSWKEFD